MSQPLKHKLIDAIQKRQKKRVRWLLKDYQGPSEGFDGVMHCAWQQNDLEMIRFLVEEGISVDERDTLGATILMYARQGDDVEFVRALLDLGADVNAENKDGETPFSHACAWNDLKVARLLYENGANINPVHKRLGGTPLDTALDNDPAIQFLIEIGAKRVEELQPASNSPDEA